MIKSCHCCGLVQKVPQVPKHADAACRVCKTRLKLRSHRENANSLAAAVALAALVLFLPAITLPFLQIERLGHTRISSLIGGIVSLFVHGEWLVALVVLLFSILLPPLKLLALIVLGTRPARIRASVRALTLRAVEQLGRWGMLDVLLVAVLLAYVKLGDLVQFTAGPGVIVFSIFVLLSLLSAYFFDPHALWDEHPMNKKQTNQVERNAKDESRHVDDTGKQALVADLPIAETVPRRRLSWVWLIPLLTLFGIGILGIREWQQSGPTITVVFSEGHGLKEGDQLRYRGTVVGRVERVALADNLNTIRVEVRLGPEAASLAREGSRFWVVRPELGLNGVAGLETIVGANYLAVLPGAVNSAPQYHFIGVDQAPLLDARESGGINIVLQAADASGLSSGSPVYYRQLRVGGVRNVSLASDGSAVEVHAYIRPAFRQLVMPESKFWKTGGIQIKASWTGLSVDVGAAQTLLQAGISMAVPPEATEPVQQRHRFQLHEQPQEEWLEWRPSLGSGTVPENLTKPAWAILQWTLPGYVYNTQEKRSGWVLPTTGAVTGPTSLLIPPKDAEPQSAHLVLAGRRIEIPDKATSVGRGLTRIEADLPERPLVPAKFRAASAPEDVLIVTATDQGPVFVSAARLLEVTGAWTIDGDVPLDPSWNGAPAVSVADGAVVGFLLLDNERPRISLYRPAKTDTSS